MKPMDKLLELGIELPPAPSAAGLYKPVLVDGDMIYFSGHLPIQNDGSLITGKVGLDLNVEEAKKAARQVGLNILSSVNNSLGSLDRVERVVKLLGLVNAPEDFTEHPQVINGCSELFAEIWGPENGVGVRSMRSIRITRRRSRRNRRNT